MNLWLLTKRTFAPFRAGFNQIKSLKKSGIRNFIKAEILSDFCEVHEAMKIRNTILNRSTRLKKNSEKAALWFETPKLREYHCDPCDKTFRDEDSLYLHEAEHEICGRDGCEFTAHPKLIFKHRKMQHDTGLYMRIGKLYTEQDIEKWVEERKRKYPTRKVMEEKKSLEEESLKRGERIKEDNSKFNKSFSKRNDKRMKSFERKSLKEKRSGKRKKRSKGEENCQTVSAALKEEASWRGSVPPFSGVRALNDYIEVPSDEKEKTDFSDDEWEISDEKQPKEQTTRRESTVMNNSLGILAACYDSDAEFSDAPVEVQTKHEANDDSAPEEVKTVHFKETENVEENLTKPKHPHQSRRKRKRNAVGELDKENQSESIRIHCGPQRKREPTLLEKLLSKEIRHERNVILQCVRYVVDNNFFLNS